MGGGGGGGGLQPPSPPASYASADMTNLIQLLHIDMNINLPQRESTRISHQLTLHHSIYHTETIAGSKVKMGISQKVKVYIIIVAYYINMSS